jgi:hypothetical protein
MKPHFLLCLVLLALFGFCMAKHLFVCAAVALFAFFVVMLGRGAFE